MIPLTLVVLGGYFHQEDEIDVEETTKAEETVVPGETKAVVIAVVSRMIIAPVMLLPLLALSSTFGSQKVLHEYVCGSLL